MAAARTSRAGATDRAADARDEVVRPSDVIRDIIGRGRLAGFVERRDGPGIVFAAAHAAFIVATGWLLWRSLGTAWAVPATIVHGIAIVHLFAPFHESTHYTAFRTRRLNTAAGWATGLVLMLPPTVFRYQHTAHHRYTQDIERDPQMIRSESTDGGFCTTRAPSRTSGEFCPDFSASRSAARARPNGATCRRHSTSPCGARRGCSVACTWRSQRRRCTWSRGSRFSSGCCRGSPGSL